jgi:hypothetical protein
MSPSGAARATQVRAAAARPSAPPRPELRVLRPQPFRAPRGPFVIAVGAVLTIGLLGVLLLNTVVNQDAFAVSALQQKSATLADEEQSLTQQVAAADSPQQLAARAHGLGMVPSVNPVFLRLADGKVLGDPVAGRSVPRAAAPAAGLPATGASPSSTPSASATAPASSTTAPGGRAHPQTSPHPNALKTKAAVVRTKAATATTTSPKAKAGR